MGAGGKVRGREGQPSEKGSDRILTLVFMVDQRGQLGSLPRTLTVNGLLGAAYARQVECWMNGPKDLLAVHPGVPKHCQGILSLLSGEQARGRVLLTVSLQSAREISARILERILRGSCEHTPVFRCGVHTDLGTGAPPQDAHSLRAWARGCGRSPKRRGSLRFLPRSEEQHV